MDRFKRKQIITKVRDFQRRNPDGQCSNKPTLNFNADDVFKLIGGDPVCWLTGRQIDLTKPSTFSFDHKTPSIKGGDNSLENLGLACIEANVAKNGSTLDEFIQLCKDVLLNFGYEISGGGGRI